MAENDKPRNNRADLVLKAVTPIVAGLLIAFAGFISERTLSSITMKQENARLITNLQIQREQAETNLRKDIFDQTLKALLTAEDPNTASQDLSERLLKLELLALNFGDSLSLAPLFTEFGRDLDRIVDSARPGGDEHQRAEVLRKRLHGLARRVASAQLSSVIQYGEVTTFSVRLSDDGKGFHHGRSEYKWPEDESLTSFAEPVEADSPDQDAYTDAACAAMFPEYECREDEILNHLLDRPDEASQEALFCADIGRRGWFEVGGRKHRMKLSLSNLDRRRRTLGVDMEVRSCGAPGDEPSPKDGATVTRDFNLDYFNFPKIDNTRLPYGQRFSIIMEKFQPNGTLPEIQISAVVFPSEYASLQDRPGMKEALGLLQRVLKEQSENE